MSSVYTVDSSPRELKDRGISAVLCLLVLPFSGPPLVLLTPLDGCTAFFRPVGTSSSGLLRLLLRGSSNTSFTVAVSSEERSATLPLLPARLAVPALSAIGCSVRERVRGDRDSCTVQEEVVAVVGCMALTANGPVKVGSDVHQRQKHGFETPHCRIQEETPPAKEKAKKGKKL
jgi:hypothetical protein